VVKGLNKMPQVKEALKEMDQGPITEQNLSVWRQGGYRDWERNQASVDAVSQFSEEAASMASAAGDERMGDQLAAVLMGELARRTVELLRPADGKPGAKLRDLRELVHQVAQLRRGDHREQWLHYKIEDRNDYVIIRIERARQRLKDQAAYFERWARQNPDFVKAADPEAAADTFIQAYGTDMHLSADEFPIRYCLEVAAREKVLEAIKAAQEAKLAPPANPGQSRLVAPAGSAPIQASPIQSNLGGDGQSNPVQANPTKSNPVQVK
jgi:hypothetical protein